jgi:starch phosphorylase
MPNDLTMPTQHLRNAVLRHLTYTMAKDAAHAQLYDWRMALSYAIRDEIVDRWFESIRATYNADAKRVYYLSMEFLLGRLLEDAITNLRLTERVQSVTRELGIELGPLLHDEPDSALGNGGLGRLAACFLESMSTLKIPAHGYGIRYEYGLFRQSFVDGRQVESPETWLQTVDPWAFERPELKFEIGFGGKVDEIGTAARWTPDEAVIAQAHDTPIVGWRGRWANTLRLWSARPTEIFDLARFNAGDFAAAAEPEALARAITRVLYPDDTTESGKELRLKQEYFFTAASLRDILRRFERTHDDLRKLPTKAAIQLNDTHPAIAGPELVRLLHDERHFSFDEAVEIARGCLAYTNHTLLPEALERWPEDLMRRLLPRHMQLIERLDAAHEAKHPSRQVALRAHGEVQMGPLAFVMAHRVNGVSKLHTRLMKDTVFAELNRLYPDRIVNETNGITPRRWLMSANPRLSSLIGETIGNGWLANLERLAELEPHFDDAGFLDAYAAVKHANKRDLAGWLARAHGVHIDPAAMIDIQIKRIHEYKRQHLNILEAIALWQDIHDAPNAERVPRVKIFAGKAAPGYAFAKQIIRLINDVAAVINADPVTSPWLQVAFLPNYNVSLAERLIPAADLSEQISTAGKEASGTGNMKMALNGALTIGTLDGANVEIRERVGAENFFLFGMTADEVLERRAMPDHAARAIADDPRLARALETLRDGTFSAPDPARYRGIADNISGPDYFLVASDFSDFWRAQREVDRAFADPARWVRAAAHNTAGSGWFSADRAIRGYMRDVWDAAPVEL